MTDVVRINEAGLYAIGMDRPNIEALRHLVAKVGGTVGTSLVSSVNGQSGAVVLTTAHISEDGNLYFTSARARSAISVAGNGLDYDETTGEVSSNGTAVNTPETLVSRDASGNFSAGTIEADLDGNAATSSAWQTARTFTIGATGKAVDGSGNVSWTLADIGLGNVDNTSDADKPVSTAQQAALDLKADLSNTVRVLAQSGATSSVTGTVSETTLASVTVPGGSMGANGAIRITFLATYTNSANAKTLRVKLGLDTFLSIALTTTATIQTLVIIRNANSQGAQIATPTTVQSGLGAATAAAATGTTDTTVDQTLVITGQLANAGETLSLRGYTVELLPAP